MFMLTDDELYTRYPIVARRAWPSASREQRYLAYKTMSPIINFFLNYINNRELDQRASSRGVDIVDQMFMSLIISLTQILSRELCF